MKLLIVVKNTIYLSWLLHLEDVLGEKFHTGEHEKLWSLECLETQGDQGW